MATFLDSIGLGGVGQKYVGLKGKLEKRGEDMTGEAIKGAEVLGSSFAFAYANGYFAKPNTDHAELTAGVPADMTIGIGLLALGLMGFAGKYSDTLCNVGTGALASYATRLGMNWGAQGRLKAAGLSATKGNTAHSHMRAPNVLVSGAGQFRAPNVVGAAPVFHPASDVHSPWRVPTH